jgi:hypothetical protein
MMATFRMSFRYLSNCDLKEKSNPARGLPLPLISIQSIADARWSRPWQLGYRPLAPVMSFLKVIAKGGRCGSVPRDSTLVIWPVQQGRELTALTEGDYPQKTSSDSRSDAGMGFKTVMERESTRAAGLDVTAELPGLGRLDHVLRELPGLSRILRNLDHLEAELRQDLSGEQLGDLAARLAVVITDLLEVEEQLWRQIDHGAPWVAYRWIAHAASWIAAARIANDYASMYYEETKEEATSALISGVHYATECALAYCRFESQLLRLDQERAQALDKDPNKRR